MPTSNLALAADVVHLVYEASPATVLDVGPGHGKYGLLLREYLPPLERLDTIEAWAPYVRAFPWLPAIYDDVSVADIRNVATDRLATYDVVLMVDVLEHLSREDGHALLERIPGRVVICTPATFFQNPEGEAIPPELHRSLWSLAELTAVRAAEVGYEKWGALLARLRPVA